MPSNNGQVYLGRPVAKPRIVSPFFDVAGPNAGILSVVFSLAFKLTDDKHLHKQLRSQRRKLLNISLTSFLILLMKGNARIAQKLHSIVLEVSPQEMKKANHGDKITVLHISLKKSYLIL